MRILFFGDIVGKRARASLLENLGAIMAENNADFAVANAENAAHGFGITDKIAAELLKKFDALTLGDHTLDKREIITLLKAEPRVLRPHNWGKVSAGSGVGVFNKNGKRIVVINLLGSLFMNRTEIGNPFLALEEILKEFRLGVNADAIFVDFHCEATSEKNAMGRAFDGRVSAVIGTHTHIPTADALILPKGTAYMTDVGACFDQGSIIGMDAAAAIGRFYGKETKLKPAEGEPTLCGVVVEIGKDGLARGIKPLVYGKPWTRSKN